ncbi:hypothetical protein [Nocardioides flavescens]|uniref:Uncharacterized protein n=1 Tax=Nocardioides flavescens TaxID=2691959 RepID=A0A6L7EQ27_9ACTN|nr:hypothetical protein [Nocardioides flavescens]MXG89487.1 hypothetical protein [Nocardioides flavescens]
MDADDVRALLRDVPSRWRSLHLVHTGIDDVEAWLRHGELEVRRSDGTVRRESGFTPTSWTVRDIEPIWTSYTWAAMLDPYELSEHVDLADVREVEVEGRPAVAFRAVARDGYDPICTCCPLVLTEVAWRLEHGDDRPLPPDLPTAADITLDLETGIVVVCEPVGGAPGRIGFRNRILGAS